MQSVHDGVLVRNPKDGQVIQTTRKVWESVYKDKGFELVKRDAKTKPGSTPAGNAGNVAGPGTSAADIAARLGVGQAQASQAGIEERTPGNSIVDGRRIIGERQSLHVATPAGNADEVVIDEGNASNEVEANSNVADLTKRPGPGKDSGGSK